jgi:glycosyltransferase involved in cell wall biosynthesis
LCKALGNQGHQVHILTRVDCHAEGLHANCVLHPDIDGWNWSTARWIRRWVKENDLSIVNLQYQAAAFDMHPAINLLPGKIAGVPMVVTFHDLKVPYLFPKAGPVRWWSMRLLASRAAGVIVTNQEDQIRLQSSRLIKHLAVIPIGSNIAPHPPSGYDRTAWREKMGVLPGEILIGYFGFLHESKGGEDLLEAVYRLKKKDIPAKLLMIGGRTGSSDATILEYAKQLEDMIDSMDIQDRVIWTGFVTAEEVSANLLALDYCMLPYRDGVSFRRGSLMAALAHGCPIISTTPAVPLPELVHLDNMYLVPAKAPVALAEAVITLRKNPVLTTRLAKGSNKLSRGFQWDPIAAATVKFFESLGVENN